MHKENLAHICNYSAKKKNEILLFTITWMDLEGIILSDISHRKRQIMYDHSYMRNLKPKPKGQGHRYREQSGDCQRQGDGELKK